MSLSEQGSIELPLFPLAVTSPDPRVPCPTALQEPRHSASRDGREPLQLSNNRRRSSSRSRSEREELDRLLMAGQPTTLLASAGKGTAGGAAGWSRNGQRSTVGGASGGSWVSPLVLA